MSPLPFARRRRRAFDPYRRSSSRRAALLGIWLQVAALPLIATSWNGVLLLLCVAVTVIMIALAAGARVYEILVWASWRPASKTKPRGRLRDEAIAARLAIRRQYDEANPIAPVKPVRYRGPAPE